MHESQQYQSDFKNSQKHSAGLLVKSIMQNEVDDQCIRLQERIDALLHLAVETAKGLSIDHPRVLVYGINGTADILIEGSPNNGIQIVALTDSYKDKKYERYMGIPVVSPKQAAQLEVDLAIVVSFTKEWRDEMKATLVRFGATFPIVIFNKFCVQYAKSLLPPHRELSRFIDLTWRLPRNAVVFVAKIVHFNQLRMSIALRRRGWQTVSVVFDEGVASQHQQFFDYVFHLNIDLLTKGLPKLGPVLIHSQAWMFSNHVPVILDASRSHYTSHIAEFLDIHQFVIPLEHEEVMLPHMAQAWAPPSGDFQTFNAFQRNCENHILKHADGVIFSGSEEQKHILIEERGAADRAISFQCFPLPDYFVDWAPISVRAPWHLAFVGGVIPFGEKFPKQIFGDAQIYEVSKVLAEQGIYIHIFNNPYLGRGDRLIERYPEYVELAEKNPYIEFSEGAFPWKLGFKIGHFHYGMMLYLFDGVLIGERHFQTVIPSKLFSYLEAGIPVLVSSRFTAVCEIVERYGIGISIDDEELTDIVSILDQANYMLLRENVRAARGVLSMDKEIQKLINFYESTREISK